MAEVKRRGEVRALEVWKQGLNWYFREGRRALSPRLEGVPSIGRADLGRAEWERRCQGFRVRLSQSRNLMGFSRVVEVGRLEQDEISDLRFEISEMPDRCRRSGRILSQPLIMFIKRNSVMVFL
jgi:hypothetical protein